MQTIDCNPGGCILLVLESELLLDFVVSIMRHSYVSKFLEFFNLEGQIKQQE